MTSYSEEEYYYLLDNLLLNATHHLRHVFKNRWQAETGKEWIDNNESIIQFFSGHGKIAYQKAQHFQKIVLKSRTVEEWDLSILALVIQNFGDEKQYEHENDAIYNLKKMRNDLAHHHSKKIRKDEYYENVKIFHSSMKTLAMSDDDINKLVKRAEATSSLKAFQYVTTLFKNAADFLHNGKIQQARECYNEAVETPNLLLEKLGTAHEKRAEFHLNLIKNPGKDEEKITLAFRDAEKAVQLNDESWNAHYLLAWSLRWKNNLQKAIHHYQRALAISPEQKHVKAELDGCKVIAGIHSRQDHLNPCLMPTTMGDCIREFEEGTGIKMSEEMFVQLMEKGKASGGPPGDDHYRLGFKHYLGLGVSVDYTEAVRHYAVAANKKHAEAKYYLANCYLNGHGADQDVQKALRLLREVAEMDPKTGGSTTPLKCNLGVAMSQHALGLLHESGIGVDVDYKEAAFWYQRAMDNGSGGSAYSLGNLYAEGRGVACDLKMAEVCWKEALNLRAVLASAQLVAYYMNEMEPEKALEMFRTGRKLQCDPLLQMSEKEFHKHVEEKKMKIREMRPALEAFEKANKLPVKGLTFNERIYRKLYRTNPNSAKLKAVMERSLTAGSCAAVVDKRQPINFEMLQKIQERAANGSETAKKVMETFTYNAQLIELITNEERTENTMLKALDLLYNCVIREFILVCFTETCVKSLKEILKDLLENKKFNKKGDVDMKIRLCYAMFNLQDTILDEKNMFAVELLKEGIRRYPENISYYSCISGMLSFKKQFKLSEYYAEEGLKVDPNNVTLLHLRGSKLFQEAYGNGKIERCVKVMEKFLSAAPSDDKRVPAVLYRISYLYLREQELKYGDSLASVPRDKLQLVEAFYKRGKLAEKDQLPCYLPYEDVDAKILVESFLTKPEIIRGGGSVDSSSLSWIADGGAEAGGVLERKQYLRSPTRKSFIKFHRATLKDMEQQMKKQRGRLPISITMPPALIQSRAKGLSKLKPCYLTEMDPTADQIFHNRVIDLTIIDEPNKYLGPISILAEDDNGDVTGVQIYNVDKTKENLAKLGVGCRIGIINPYISVGALHQSFCLRNDEPDCIVYMRKIEKMCRFCGEENSSVLCNKCRRPYCSKECMNIDAKMMDHKLVCSLK